MKSKKIYKLPILLLLLSLLLTACKKDASTKDTSAPSEQNVDLEQSADSGQNTGSKQDETPEQETQKNANPSGSDAASAPDENAVSENPEKNNAGETSNTQTEVLANAKPLEDDWALAGGYAGTGTSKLSISIYSDIWEPDEQGRQRIGVAELSEKPEQYIYRDVELAKVGTGVYQLVARYGDPLPDEVLLEAFQSGDTVIIKVSVNGQLKDTYQLTERYTS